MINKMLTANLIIRDLLEDLGSRAGLDFFGGLDKDVQKDIKDRWREIIMRDINDNE